MAHRGASCRFAVRFVLVNISSALLVTALVWSPPSADASTFYWRTSETGCLDFNSADSAYHTFYYNSGLSSTMRSATDYARWNAVDPMDTTTAMVALAVDTDVVVYDQDYTSYCAYTWHPASEMAGLATCSYLTANPAGACERFEVRYDEFLDRDQVDHCSALVGLPRDRSHPGPGPQSFGGRSQLYVLRGN